MSEDHLQNWSVTIVFLITCLILVRVLDTSLWPNWKTEVHFFFLRTSSTWGVTIKIFNLRPLSVTVDFDTFVCPRTWNVRMEKNFTSVKVLGDLKIPIQSQLKIDTLTIKFIEKSNMLRRHAQGKNLDTSREFSFSSPKGPRATWSAPDRGTLVAFLPLKNFDGLKIKEQNKTN